MSKNKQPYIPLYIGDWEQDTNTISLEAEGALLKITFKLWKSSARGLLQVCYKQLAILLKKDEQNTRKIIQELALNDVLKIEKIDDETILIESRRMTREAAISQKKAENGAKGGTSKSLKNKQNSSKTLAKVKQNPEYENEYDNDNEDKGEVNFEKSENLLSEEEKKHEVVLVEDLEEKESELLNSSRWITETCMAINSLHKCHLTQPECLDYLKNFIGILKAKEDFKKPTTEVKSHFFNWLNKEIEKKKNAPTEITQPGLDTRTTKLIKGYEYLLARKNAPRP